METDEWVDIRRRDLLRTEKEFLQSVSTYKWENKNEMYLRKLVCYDGKCMQLTHDHVKWRTWILTVLPFRFRRVCFKESQRCYLMKGIAGRKPLQHGETCDRKKLLRLTNECFPRGLSKTATVIPTFANAKILCRFKQ